jgi:hypothetical protein
LQERLTRAFIEAQRILLTINQSLFSLVIAIAVTTALPMTLSNQMFIFMYDPVLQYGFTYFELGDGDELGKTSFQNYFEAHKSVYLF